MKIGNLSRQSNLWQKEKLYVDYGNLNKLNRGLSGWGERRFNEGFENDNDDDASKSPGNEKLGSGSKSTVTE